MAETASFKKIRCNFRIRKKSSKANKTDQKKSWVALQKAFRHVRKTNDDVRKVVSLEVITNS